MTNGGNGYEFPPRITSTGGKCDGGLSVKTRIENSVVTSLVFEGSCSTIPTFKITAPTATATATITLNTNKTVSGVKITSS